MILPISKLRRLTGHVAAGPTGHLVNAASVELLTTDKKSIAKSSIDREDGLFHFEFVPEGDYTLRVTNARDVTWEPDIPQPGMMAPPPGFLPAIRNVSSKPTATSTCPSSSAET
jgi:hypothetical protein